jgi:hypothetical protein
LITVKVISDRSEIDQILPRCIQFAEEVGCVLPFQYLYMPLIWWDQFNNNDGTDFTKKRGTNFLGAQSWLKNLRLFVAMDGTAIAGAIPIVSYLVKIPGEEKQMRIFTFPGDYQLMSPQDLTVSVEMRKEALWALLDSLTGCIEDKDDVVLLPYVAGDSPNIRELKLYFSEASARGYGCLAALTGRRGGVRRWTVDAILSCLRQIADRVTHSLVKDEVRRLIDDLAACPPMKLMFPRNCREYEERIRSVLRSVDEKHVPAHVNESLETLLADAPVVYPFIELPKDRDTYMGSLGRSTRVNTQNLRNRFARGGGRIERIASSRITDQDIQDYLTLHNLRWGDASASLKSDASYRFHSNLCRKLSSQGLLTLFFAHSQGRRIASCSCIDIQGRREIYLTGRDPEYDQWSAGRLVLVESILDAIDRGFGRYDMGHGWVAYKMAYAGTYTNTWGFFLSPRRKPEDFKRIYQGYECIISP